MGNGVSTYRGKTRRAVLLFGAGASLEYGAPSTAQLTKEIERYVSADPWLKHTGGDKAFLHLKATLAKYLTKKQRT